MSYIKPMISVEEAREILGSSALGMTDEDIFDVIETLDLMAKESLKKAKEKLAIKRSARDFAGFLYEQYIEEQKQSRVKNLT